VIDLVNGAATARFAFDALGKGGVLVQVGLFGGEMTIPLPLMAIRALTIQGSYVGSLDDLKSVMALAKAGKLAALPVSTEPMNQANAVLERLRDGKVTGRVVLRAEADQRVEVRLRLLGPEGDAQLGGGGEQGRALELQDHLDRDRGEPHAHLMGDIVQVVAEAAADGQAEQLPAIEPQPLSAGPSLRPVHHDAMGAGPAECDLGPGDALQPDTHDGHAGLRERAGAACIKARPMVEDGVRGWDGRMRKRPRDEMSPGVAGQSPCGREAPAGIT
jgi:Zinc-binding dehydrogenase